MAYPKISIITPSYNQGQYIEETILSILNQGYPNLEYIIIDGGSTDNTVGIIKKYEQHINYWVSEKDDGQADAINKGIKYCTGEIFNWINSDDYLAAGALFTIAEAFENPSTMVVAAAVQNFSSAGLQVLYRNKDLTMQDLLKEGFDYEYHQPGVWLRMESMKKTGLFKKQYHYCFDQEYMLRYLLKFDTVNYIPVTVAFFRMHEQSKTVSSFDRFYWDLVKIYKQFAADQKGTTLGELADRKGRKMEWRLLSSSINDISKNRISVFFKAAFVIIKDPAYRLNKRSIGWLKHIILGSRLKRK
jgi:glycosyltransferase involved in cell wall biosynthesis